MKQSSLFQSTRLRLACWYAGVMGLLLGLGGIVVYEVVSHTRWEVIDTELESVAGTLHDGLQPLLQQPGYLAPTVKNLLPGMCVAGEVCTERTGQSGRHILGALRSEGYYARFLDQSGQVLATIGSLPEVNPVQVQPAAAKERIDPALLTCRQHCAGKKMWQIFQGNNDVRYRQVSLLLETPTASTWGYLQVGKSLKEFDRSIIKLRLIFILGLPLAVGMIAAAAWWMAGLAMRPVYQSYQQIQQFTADAAHELRTPLAAIRATVEASLVNPALTLPQAQATLQTIERQNHRLSQLVQDLLLLTRLDLRVSPSSPQPCCLNDLISDLIEEFFALAIAAEIKLLTDIQTEVPLIVLGNEEHIYRILANLLTNAIQYTSADGVVTVRLTHTETIASVQVHDTGIGISPEDQTRIFDRFYRVSGDRSRKTGGSGLGLAIAQVIAQTHKGAIQVQSTLGQGSTFTLQLPLFLSP